ncbi:hypothetical protein L9F63_024899, partial [Diploptera punctata]
ICRLSVTSFTINQWQHYFRSMTNDFNLLTCFKCLRPEKIYETRLSLNFRFISFNKMKNIHSIIKMRKINEDCRGYIR